MKINVGDLLMCDGKIGMVEGIGQLQSGIPQYWAQYWVHWCGDNSAHWISERATIIYRNAYLDHRKKNG